MADPIAIYTACTICGGDGLFPNEVIDFNGNISPPVNPGVCGKCSGTGRVATGFLDGSIRALFQDILDKVEDVLDKVG